MKNKITNKTEILKRLFTSGNISLDEMLILNEVKIEKEMVYLGGCNCNKNNWIQPPYTINCSRTACNMCSDYLKTIGLHFNSSDTKIRLKHD